MSMDVNGPAWAAWLIIGATGVTLALAAAAAIAERRRFAALVPAHVAGATVLGVIGWEWLVNLPGILADTSLLYRGLSGAPGELGAQLLGAAFVAFVAGAFVAVVGIARRRPWAVVLGIGIAITRLALVAISIVRAIGFELPADQGLAWLATIVATAVPPIAAIVLLVWPIVGRGGLPLAPDATRAQPDVTSSRAA
jgi:hypothetical protein